jgi:threonine dehydrogenase-like Zn-dependent dehydrogenase
MRAAVLRHGQVEVREADDPEPGSRELLLRTLSTGICASDVHFMDHPDASRDDRSGQSFYDENRDIILGHEFVGEVIRHGPDCSDRFPVGARVTSISMRLVDGGPAIRIIGQHPLAQGSFAERIVISEDLARPVPEGVSDDAVAVVDAFAVGEFYVAVSKIQPGVIPIVIGAGAVGISAVAALAARNVHPIMVSDRRADRREMARSFGADILVDAQTTPSPFEIWRRTATEAGIRKPPSVYECAGAAGLMQSLIDSCEPGTRIYAAGGWYTNDTINVTAASKKGVMIQFGGGPRAADWDRTLEAVCKGSLDPLPSVGRVIGLEEVPAALEEVRRADGPPRIVVHPHGGPSGRPARP